MRICDVALSSDDSLLAVACRINGFRVYHARELHLLQQRRPALEFGEARHVAWMEDNRVLTGVTDNGDCLVWDVTSGKLLQTVQRTQNTAPRSTALAANGRVAAAFYSNRSTSTPTPFQHLARKIYAYFEERSTRHDNDVAPQFVINRLSRDTCESRAPSTEFYTASDASALSPDGMLVAFLSRKDEETSVQLWDTQIGKRYKQIRIHKSKEEPTRFCFSSSGRFLAVLTRHSLLDIWDTNDTSRIASIAVPPGDTASASFSPHDSQIAYFSSEQRELRVYSITDTINPPALIGHADVLLTLDGSFSATPYSRGIREICVAPDAPLSATYAGDETLQIWDLRSAKLRGWSRAWSWDFKSRSIGSEGDTLIRLAAHKDLVAIAVTKITSDGTDAGIQIYSAHTGDRLKTALGFDRIDHLSFVDDGSRLLFNKQWVLSLGPPDDIKPYEDVHISDAPLDDDQRFEIRNRTLSCYGSQSKRVAAWLPHVDLARRFEKAEHDCIAFADRFNFGAARLECALPKELPADLPETRIDPADIWQFKKHWYRWDRNNDLWVLDHEAVQLKDVLYGLGMSLMLMALSIVPIVVGGWILWLIWGGIGHLFGIGSIFQRIIAAIVCAALIAVIARYGIAELVALLRRNQTPMLSLRAEGFSRRGPVVGVLTLSLFITSAVFVYRWNLSFGDLMLWILLPLTIVIVIFGALICVRLRVQDRRNKRDHTSTPSMERDL